MKRIIAFFTIVMLVCFNAVFAAESGIQKGFKAKTVAPEPTTCVTGTFSKSGDVHWSQVSLKLTNNCGKDIDFQNSGVTFNNADNLDVTFWGNFSPLSYPDGLLQITSQANPTGGYIASFSLHFPEESWARTILHDKESFTIIYGTSNPSYNPSSVKVYISGGPPVTTGGIDLTNATAKPAKIDQGFVPVDILLNANLVFTAQVAWSGTFSVANLSPGVYTISPRTMIDTDQNSYEGTAVPKTVTVVANQKVSSTITYKQIISPGTINIKSPVLPSALTGYTGTPTITFTRQDTGTVVTKTVPWNTTTAVSTLENGVTYQFSTPAINYNGNNCVGSFNPTSLTSSSTNPLTTQLTYTCTPVASGTINVKAPALPTALSGYTATPMVVLTRQDTGGTTTKSIPWNTTTSVSGLIHGVTYQFSTPSIAFNGNNCVGTFNPSNVMASSVTPLLTQLSYTCTPVSQAKVTINVSGLPCETTSITVSFQPTSGAVSTKSIAISKGSGSDFINLVDGVVYNVSSTTVTGYTALFNPQPLMAKPNVIETVTYQPHELH